jgi:hypothetical protein
MTLATMTSAEPVLNDVLIALHRSLLQYTHEAWPWTTAHSSATRDAIAAVATEQRETVDRLTELLRDRGYPVSFSTYPDFSRFNYVSIEFLLKQLVKNQEQVVSLCESAARELADEPEDGGLVHAIAVAETDRLRRLRDLAAKKL